VSTFISFNGIIFMVYHADHDPPHIHIRYGGEQAKIALDGTVLLGRLHPHTLTLVRDWLKRRQAKVWEIWDLAKSGKKVPKLSKEWR
jgi:hypothetical protein